MKPGVKPAADPTAWLAEALARQVRAWSAAAGAPAGASDAAAALAQRLSLALQDGHVCLPLAGAAAFEDPGAAGAEARGAQAGQPPGAGDTRDEARDEARDAAQYEKRAAAAIPAPAGEPARQQPGPGSARGATLRALLLASGVCATPAAPGAKPLLLDDAGRLYLQRQFDEERRLAQRLRRAARAADDGAAESPAARALLRALFPPDPEAGGGADWQQLAAALALQRRLVLISGGPGTGKTHTVAQLLACLLAARGQLRIALAAPTGKAAARLAQALAERAALLPDAVPAAVRAALPRQATTVHRLLGAGPEGFAHGAQHPLAIDLLVVDEASMLDLALATRLLEAVPDDARIVLLGDKDQLAAVEAGAVFAVACADPSLSAATRAALAAATGTDAAAIVPPAGSGAIAGALADSTVWLVRSRRFGADSGIGRLAAAVRSGDAGAALTLLQAGGAGVRWIDDTGRGPAAATLAAIDAGFEPYLRALARDPGDAAAVAAAFGRFRVLAAVRAGPRGVAALNRHVEARLRARLAPLHAALAADPQTPWLAGRAVMVLRNDPLLRLANGDVGFVLPGAGGRPQVFFEDAGGGWRALDPHRLPPCETAFAGTVHKAQGSEFDQVLLLLPAQPGRGMSPPGRPKGEYRRAQPEGTPVSRELLYTALTRARRHVTVAAGAAAVGAAVANRGLRASGLIDRLREADAAAGPAGAPP